MKKIEKKLKKRHFFQEPFLSSAIARDKGASAQIGIVKLAPSAGIRGSAVQSGNPRARLLFLGIVELRDPSARLSRPLPCLQWFDSCPCA